MRPNVTTQIQQTKGVRRTTDDGVAYVGQEIADGFKAGVNSTTFVDSDLPDKDRQLVAEAIIDIAVDGAECVTTKNSDGTFTRTYSFPFKCAV